MIYKFLNTFHNQLATMTIFSTSQEGNKETVLKKQIYTSNSVNPVMDYNDSHYMEECSSDSSVEEDSIHDLFQDSYNNKICWGEIQVILSHQLCYILMGEHRTVKQLIGHNNYNVHFDFLSKEYHLKGLEKIKGNQFQELGARVYDIVNHHYHSLYPYDHIDKKDNTIKKFIDQFDNDRPGLLNYPEDYDKKNRYIGSRNPYFVKFGRFGGVRDPHFGIIGKIEKLLAYLITRNKELGNYYTCKQTNKPPNLIGLFYYFAGAIWDDISLLNDNNNDNSYHILHSNNRPSRKELKDHIKTMLKNINTQKIEKELKKEISDITLLVQLCNGQDYHTSYNIKEQEGVTQSQVMIDCNDCQDALNIFNFITELQEMGDCYIFNGNNYYINKRLCDVTTIKIGHISHDQNNILIEHDSENTPFILPDELSGEFSETYFEKNIFIKVQNLHNKVLNFNIKPLSLDVKHKGETFDVNKLFNVNKLLGRDARGNRYSNQLLPPNMFLPPNTRQYYKELQPEWHYNACMYEAGLYKGNQVGDISANLKYMFDVVHKLVPHGPDEEKDSDGSLSHISDNDMELEVNENTSNANVQNQIDDNNMELEVNDNISNVNVQNQVDDNDMEL